MNVLNRIDVVGDDGTRDVVLKIQRYSGSHSPLSGTTRRVAVGFAHVLESDMEELSVVSDTEFQHPYTDVTYKAQLA